jgi:hypothetical protein
MIAVAQDEHGRLPALGAEASAMGLEPVGEFGRAPRPPVGQLVYRLPDAITADVWTHAEARRRGREMITESHQIVARAVALHVLGSGMLHWKRADLEACNWTLYAVRACQLGMKIDASGLFHAVMITRVSKDDGLAKWTEDGPGGGTITASLDLHGLEIVAGLCDLDGTPIGMMARLLGQEAAAFLREMEEAEKKDRAGREGAKARKEEGGEEGKRDGGVA